MIPEFENSASEFIHHPGERFWIATEEGAQLHKIKRIEQSAFPDGRKYEIDIAWCGLESSDSPEDTARFIGANFSPLPSDLKTKTVVCRKCYATGPLDPRILTALVKKN
jgi:hypothetical protein